MSEIFTIECDALPAGTRVVAVDGTEAISTLYRYEIDVAVDDDADLASALGAAATLVVQGPSPAQRTVVHGVLGGARAIEHLQDRSIYRLVIGPRIASLGADRHSRVFVGEAVPAIVQTLFHEAGYTPEDYTFRLSGTYAPVDFICQYQESTLDFVLRWLEREGIYWYFEHDSAREKLVMLDDLGQEAKEVRVHASHVSSAGLGEAVGIRRWHAEHRLLPAKVCVEDYDYMHPGLMVRGEAPVVKGGRGELRVRDANVRTPKQAQRAAKLRAEALLARQTVYRGDGRLYGVHAGEKLALDGHPRAHLDGSYRIVSARLRGHTFGGAEEVKRVLGRQDEPDEVLRTEFEAIPADVQFRPEPTAQAPRVYGMEAGVIDGDVESEYAQLDEHGRYLVKLGFDEGEGRGSHASARIRMMQPHAGSPGGMHFPLRKGTEVIVTFLGGDPDRPLIVGAAPNAVTPSTVTADNATKNIIHTGGNNRIVIEDAAGKQHIHLRTPHKNTYLHLGAPFNPQYNHITNTAGTSITYTEDISTSFTGTDAHTIVEDARVTVIGRSRVTQDEPEGQEIGRLLGWKFVGAIDSDESIIYEQIASDAKKVFDPSTNPAGGSTGAALQTASNVGSGTAGIADLQQAVNKAVLDLQTLLSDASTFASSTPANYSGMPAPGDWKTQVNDALEAMNQVKIAADGLSGPQPLPVFEVALQLDFAALAVIAVITDKPAAPVLRPPNPSPNVQPTYIRLKHLDANDTKQPIPGESQKIDDAIKAAADPKNGVPDLERFDATAMDFGTGGDPTASPPLHPGSDVKIVGGDNVTMVQQDVRSQVGGHSYGLVQGGQTSVVRGGAHSTVYAPSHGLDGPAPGSGSSNPIPPVPPYQGGPPYPATGPTPASMNANIAQSSEVYGDKFAWVNGDKHSTVTGTAWSTIQGDQHSTVNQTKYSTVNGDQHTTVNGNKSTFIPQMYTSYVSQRFNFTTSKTAITGVDIQTTALALKYLLLDVKIKALEHAEWTMKIDGTGVHVESVYAAHLKQSGADVHSSATHIGAHGSIILI